jgi:hypothetical protein
MKAVFLCSNTPSNVGNGFFYCGIQHVLSQVAPEFTLVSMPFPAHNPFSLTDAHGRNAFFIEHRLNGFDALIVAGPVLDRKFEAQFGPILRNAKSLGKMVFLLSCGGRRYDEEERRVCRDLLSEIRPDILVSRDAETYECYHDIAIRSYDGICFAFYVAEAYAKYALGIDEEYCVATFDFSPERPLAEYLSWQDGAPQLKKPYPSTGTRSLRNKVSMVMQRRFDAEIAGLKIVRPCHRPVRSARTMFHKLNAFVDYNYMSFLHLYANTKFTITDRLHAAVATIAFGRPAYLPLNSNRVKLLNRAGCSQVLQDFFVPDFTILEQMRFDQKRWLEDNLPR